MKILIVGSLSWNPERILSLSEEGHELFGLWGRSMAWDQGPYPVLEGRVPAVQLASAAQTIRERKIDCVYSLYQTYEETNWGPPQPAIEHDRGVWELLRHLLVERERGEFDVPFVHHYGYDVLLLDLDVVRALDGHIFCNEKKLAYWTKPVNDGGCGIDAFGDRTLATFLDGDLPKAEFMNDRFAMRLSDRTGEPHTVCIGRPFNIDYVAAAQQGIHVHLYGNHYDDLYPFLAQNLSPRAARRHRDLLGRYLHVHPSLQTIGMKWSEVQGVKNQWVEEFSQYDAGWSYIGSPYRWPPLDDRGAIPNRLSTYFLSGLPVITDPRPGHYRYELPQSIDAAVELRDADYCDLRAQLETEIQSREKSARVRHARRRYSFDAGIPVLLHALEAASRRYYSRPTKERTRFARTKASTLELGSSRQWRKTRPVHGLVRGFRAVTRLVRGHELVRRRLRAKRLATVLEHVIARNTDGASLPQSSAPLPKTSVRRIAALERFAEPSRRCDSLTNEVGVQLLPIDLHEVHRGWRFHLRGLLTAGLWWLTGPFRIRHALKIFRACLRARDVPLGALRWVPEVCQRVRRGEIQELACYSAKGFDVVPLLAEELGVRFTEVLATRTQYFGEFAFELQAVIPYAYWLHLNGRLRQTISRGDTRCLYYFSEDHEERPGRRSYVPTTEFPSGEMGFWRVDKMAFPVHLDTTCWVPPPYKERFRDKRFRWSRPTCVVCNKTSDESYLGGPRVNSIDTDLLVELVGRLRHQYQVVYNRPRGTDIVNDYQLVGDLGEIEFLKSRFPDVLNIQELHAEHPEWTFNELQLRLFAGCEHFVSVVGGSSYLASWFGGINVVFARAGLEVECKAFENWFDKFSGARVVAVSSPESLLRVVDRELLGHKDTEE